MVYKFIDLFAGIGGIKIGFSNIGFECIYSNDIDKNCKKTFDLNFNNKLDISGIKAIQLDQIGDYDILVGGFPCQSFSIAGYRKGFEDKNRGDLIFDVFKLLEIYPVKSFMLENVKNLVSHNHGKTLETMLSHLQSLGYYVKYAILNTMDFGNLPQNRERVYMVGFQKKQDYQRFEFPNKIPLNRNIVDILEKNIVDEKYYYNNKPLYEKLKDSVISKNIVYQWRRKYVRENKSGVCPTLTANMGTGGHNVPIILDDYGIRKLTPRECARLQGFDDNYKFPNLADCHLYKQFGNSVSIPVIERIAKNIQSAL